MENETKFLCIDKPQFYSNLLSTTYATKNERVILMPPFLFIEKMNADKLAKLQNQVRIGGKGNWHSFFFICACSHPPFRYSSS